MIVLDNAHITNITNVIYVDGGIHYHLSNPKRNGGGKVLYTSMPSHHTSLNSQHHY